MPDPATIHVSPSEILVVLEDVQGPVLKGYTTYESHGFSWHLPPAVARALIEALEMALDATDTPPTPDQRVRYRGWAYSIMDAAMTGEKHLLLLYSPDDPGRGIAAGKYEARQDAIDAAIRHIDAQHALDDDPSAQLAVWEGTKQRLYGETG